MIKLLGLLVGVRPCLVATVLQDNLVKKCEAIIKELLPFFTCSTPAIGHWWAEWSYIRGRILKRWVGVCLSGRLRWRRLWRCCKTSGLVPHLGFISLISGAWPSSTTSNLLVLHGLHLVFGDSALAIDPLALDHVPVLILHHLVHTPYVFEGHKSKASRLLCPLVLEDDTVLYLPVGWKVVPEVEHREVVRQATHEYFAVLMVVYLAGLGGWSERTCRATEIVFSEFVSFCWVFVRWHDKILIQQTTLKAISILEKLLAGTATLLFCHLIFIEIHLVVLRIGLHEAAVVHFVKDPVYRATI